MWLDVLQSVLRLAREHPRLIAAVGLTFAWAGLMVLVGTAQIGDGAAGSGAWNVLMSAAYAFIGIGLWQRQRTAWNWAVGSNALNSVLAPYQILTEGIPLLGLLLLQVLILAFAALSRALGQRLEQESAARREGLTTSTREQANAPIDNQLQKFLIHCRSKGRSATYVGQLEQRIRRVIGHIGARRLQDIDAGKVETALMELKTSRGFEGKGKASSVSTRNEYITSLQTFTK